VNSIRSELNSILVGEFRSRESALAGLFSIFIAIFSAAWVGLLAETFIHFSGRWTIPARLVAIVFIGTRWRALGNMMHECAHGIFVRRAEDNTRLGHFLAAIDFSSFPDYAAQHLTHHAYLGDPTRDQDFKSRRVFLAGQSKFKQIGFLFLSCITILPVICVLFRPVFWSKKTPLWANLLRCFLAILLISCLSIPTLRSTGFFYLVLPYLTTYQWMKIFSDACDHIFLYAKEAPIERSRNHLFPGRILNSLFFPRNDGFHLLHHLFPSLPTQFYPRAHSHLLAHPWYANKKHSILFNKSSTTAVEIAVNS